MLSSASSLAFAQKQSLSPDGMRARTPASVAVSTAVRLRTCQTKVVTGVVAHDSLLICAIVLTPVAGVIVTIPPKQPSATLSYDFLILSDLHRFAARGASRRGDGTSDSAGLVGAPCTNPFANYMQEALLPFEEGDEVPGFGGALGGAEADALEVVEGGAGVEQRVASPAAVREQEDDVQAGPPTSATCSTGSGAGPGRLTGRC